MTGRLACLLAVLLVCGGCNPHAKAAPPTAAAAGAQARPVPLLAYYYLWFNPTSWNRAKIDYPLLGRYSSDDGAVMRRHVEWAKEAGIDGFIVSWKSTETLDRRLDQLVRVADRQGFKLAIIYEGLDFQRKPLPVARVQADLVAFAARWANDPAFDLFGKPVVIWSGTWAFSRAEVARVAAAVRPHLELLASEHSVRGYQRLAGTVDGDAYYWSSVNPDTNARHGVKLADMSAAVHRDHGLWFAPAAPGFDARKVGGRSVVERHDGATLRAEFAAALRSAPDAVGLISWNEFSENSHVEPSRRYGMRYVEVLAQLRGVRFRAGGSAGAGGDFDSSAPAGRDRRRGPLLLTLGTAFALLVVGSLTTIARRRNGHLAG